MVYPAHGAVSRRTHANQTKRRRPVCTYVYSCQGSQGDIVPGLLCSGRPKKKKKGRTGDEIDPAAAHAHAHAHAFLVRSRRLRLTRTAALATADLLGHDMTVTPGTTDRSHSGLVQSRRGRESGTASACVPPKLPSASRYLPQVRSPWRALSAVKPQRREAHGRVATDLSGS